MITNTEYADQVFQAIEQYVYGRVERTLGPVARKTIELEQRTDDDRRELVTILEGFTRRIDAIEGSLKGTTMEGEDLSTVVAGLRKSLDDQVTRDQTFERRLSRHSEHLARIEDKIKAIR